MQAIVVCTEMKKRGHEVVLLCSPESRLEKEARGAGIRVLPLSPRSYHYPFSLFALRRLLIEEQIEVVHSQLSRDLKILVPAVLSIPNRPPVFLTKRIGSSVRKKDLYHRWLYRHVSLVIAVSEVIRKNVIDTCPINADRVEKVFDGVDLDRFDPSNVDREQARGQLSLLSQDLVIGMVGRFTPGKGHEEFIEAADILSRRFPHGRFLIVGDASFGEDAYAQSIRQLGRSLVEKGVLKFIGFRSDVPTVMRAMDILAFPSHAEAFGDVLIESMAMELPVVSTNCDGVLDIVIDGETGIHVPPRNGMALAEGLTRLIEDESLRRSMGEAGRRRAVAVFSLKERTDKIERIYYRFTNGQVRQPVRSWSSLRKA